MLEQIGNQPCLDSATASKNFQQPTDDRQLVVGAKRAGRQGGGATIKNQNPA